MNSDSEFYENKEYEVESITIHPQYHPGLLRKIDEMFNGIHFQGTFTMTWPSSSSRTQSRLRSLITLEQSAYLTMHKFVAALTENLN